MLNRFSNILLIGLTEITFLLLLVASFSLYHQDCVLIIHWATTLLDTVFNNSITQYSNILLQKSNPTNYSMLLNVLVALFILPAILGAKFLSFTILFKHYIVILKFFLLLSTLLCGGVIYKILIKTGNDKISSWQAVLLYFLSPVVLYSNLSMGQIDIIAVLLLILGFLLLYKHRFILMGIIFGISFLVKPYAALIFAPVYSLLFFGHKKKILLASICTLSIIISVNLLTYVFIDNYYENAISVIHYYDLYKMIFEHKILGIPIFFILFSCVIFLSAAESVISNANFNKCIKYAFMGFLVFMLSVQQHSQWTNYILPFVIIELFTVIRRFPACGLTLYTIINFCFPIYLYHYLFTGLSFFRGLFIFTPDIHQPLLSYFNSDSIFNLTFWILIISLNLLFALSWFPPPYPAKKNNNNLINFIIFLNAIPSVLFYAIILKI